jgi:SEC-C motif-containing protein
MGNLDYIDRTQAPELEGEDEPDLRPVLEETTWRGLEVLRVEAGGVEDQVGQVEFVFRYRRRGRDFMQHELSQFRRDNGQWIYQSSEMNPKSPPRQVSKPGRNDPCSCGSGKKYKKCCGQ